MKKLHDFFSLENVTEFGRKCMPPSISGGPKFDRDAVFVSITIGDCLFPLHSGLRAPHLCGP